MQFKSDSPLNDERWFSLIPFVIVNFAGLNLEKIFSEYFMRTKMLFYDMKSLKFTLSYSEGERILYNILSLALLMTWCSDAGTSWMSTRKFRSFTIETHTTHNHQSHHHHYHHHTNRVKNSIILLRSTLARLLQEARLTSTSSASINKEEVETTTDEK